MNQPATQTLAHHHSAEGIIAFAAWSDSAGLVQRSITGILHKMGYESIILDRTLSAKDIVNHAIAMHVHAIGLYVYEWDERLHVEQVLDALRVRGLSLPVLLLGDAVDQTYAQKVALPDEGVLYRGGVYYCEDEAEVLQVLKQIILFTPPPVTHEHDHEEASQGANTCSGCSGCGEACSLSTAHPVGNVSKPPSPPFWGYRTELVIPWDAVLELIDQRALLIRWVALAQASDVPAGWQEPAVTLTALLRKLTLLLHPRVLYGYLPVQSDGNALILYAYQDPVMRCDIGRLALPRTGTRNAPDPAGYFASVDSHCMDVLAIQAVTFDDIAFDALGLGNNASQRIPLLLDAVLHAIRAWITQRIRVDLSIAGGASLTWERNSAEYNADIRLLFDLLPLRDALGLALTQSGDVVQPYTAISCFIHGMDETLIVG